MLSRFENGYKIITQFSKIFNTLNFYEDYNKGTSIGCKGALSSIEFNGYRTDNGYEFYEVINGSIDINHSIIFDNNKELVSISNVNLYTYNIEYTFTFSNISTNLSEEDLIRMINELNSINVTELHKYENNIIFKVNVEYKNEYKNIHASGLPFINVKLDRDDIQRWLLSNRLASYINDFNSMYLKDTIGTEINIVDIKSININNLNEPINKNCIISNIKENGNYQISSHSWRYSILKKITVCLPDNSTIYVKAVFFLEYKCDYPYNYLYFNDIYNKCFENREIYDSNDNEIGYCNIASTSAVSRVNEDDAALEKDLIRMGYEVMDQSATNISIQDFSSEYINIAKNAIRNQLSSAILNFILTIKN